MDVRKRFARSGGLLGITLLLGTACGEFDLVEFDAATPTPEIVDTTFRTGVLTALRVAPQECSNGGCHNMNDTNPASLLELGKGVETILEQADVDRVYALLTGSGGGLQRQGYGIDVDTDNPADSLLLRFPLGADENRHRFKTPWEGGETAAYKSVKGWIESGAPNN